MTSPFTSLPSPPSILSLLSLSCTSLCKYISTTQQETANQRKSVSIIHANSQCPPSLPSTPLLPNRHTTPGPLHPHNVICLVEAGQDSAIDWPTHNTAEERREGLSSAAGPTWEMSSSVSGTTSRRKPLSAPVCSRSCRQWQARQKIAMYHKATNDPRPDKCKPCVTSANNARSVSKCVHAY